MQPPDPKAPYEIWLSWCDKNYPFTGYRPCREGFEVLRGIEEPQLRVDVAQALTRALPPDPLSTIPPMDPALSARRDPEQQTIGDWAKDAYG